MLNTSTLPRENSWEFSTNFKNKTPVCSTPSSNDAFFKLSNNPSINSFSTSDIHYLNTQSKIFCETFQLHLNQRLLTCKLIASGKFLHCESRWDSIADTLITATSWITFLHLGFLLKIIEKIFKCVHDKKIEKQTEQLANSFYSITSMENSVAFIALQLLAKYQSLLEAQNIEQAKLLAEETSNKIMNYLQKCSDLAGNSLYQNLLLAIDNI